MKKKLTIIGIIAACVMAVALLGIRIYGEFETEHDTVISRANDADQQAQVLDAKYNADERELNCDTEWLKFKNAELQKEIIELKGGVGVTPMEPSCEGYAISIDESLSMTEDAMQATLDAESTKEYAKYEREYSTNRGLQSKFLALRLWASLKGTKLDPTQQGLMQKDEDDKKPHR